MRDYIQKNLQPRIRAYVSHKRTDIDQRYADETFNYSSIPGKATTREGLKNCFIAGEVIQKGSCRLLGCSVAPNVQLILEDGATAVNCLFGSAAVQHNGPMVIRIGKNALLQDCLVLADTDIGDNSVVYRCMFGSINQRFSVHMPTFKCGKNSLLYCTSVQMTPNKAEERPVSIELGNRAVLLMTVLKASGSIITAGDDFILCAYVTALQMCLNGINCRTLDITIPPMLYGGRDSEHSVLCTQDQHPRFDAYPNTTIGNRFYCGCECILDTRDVKRPVPTAVIGDDVQVVSPSKAVLRQNYERSTIDLILCADTLEVSDGVTLMGQGNQRWPVTHYRKLAMKENAVFYFTGDNDASSELLAAPGKVTVM